MEKALLSPMNLGAQGDGLTEAFNEACVSGDIKAASALLSDLDSILLTARLGANERFSALKHIRRSRERLEELRAECRPATRRLFPWRAHSLAGQTG